jgi:hypothetical protein
VTGYSGAYVGDDQARDVRFVQLAGAPGHDSHCARAQRSVLLSMPGRALGDSSGSLAKLWTAAVVRGLEQLPPMKLIALGRMAALLPERLKATVLPDDVSVATLNDCLAGIDLVITSNWSSYLAARAASHGARVLVTFNDLTLRRRHSPLRRASRNGQRRARRFAIADDKSFATWLPRTIPRFWPGVDIDVGRVIWNARAVPLFQPAQFAEVAARPIAPLPVLSNRIRPADVVRELTTSRHAPNP